LTPSPHVFFFVSFFPHTFPVPFLYAVLFRVSLKRRKLARNAGPVLLAFSWHLFDTISSLHTSISVSTTSHLLTFTSISHTAHITQKSFKSPIPSDSKHGASLEIANPIKISNFHLTLVTPCQRISHHCDPLGTALKKTDLSFSTLRQPPNTKQPCADSLPRHEHKVGTP
jgi:hypothetical protein